MNEQKFSPKLLIALSLYITSLFASNTLGLKLMPFIFGTHLSVSVFFFPFVFITTDVVGQVYGKKMAKFFVWAGFLSIVLFLLYSLISLQMPWSPQGLWAQEGYNTIFGVSFRISIASLLAFVIAEYQDVVTFFFLKKVTKKDRFWFNSNLSNLWSQLLDTLVFMTVAFVGIYSFKIILLMSIPWWIYKVCMGAFYTPLSYVGIYFLRDKEHEHTSN